MRGCDGDGRIYRAVGADVDDRGIVLRMDLRRSTFETVFVEGYRG